MRRALGLVLVLALVALAALAALPFALDTAPGRAWLVRQLPALQLESGLNIRVAGIDGNLWGTARLRGVELRDPAGTFARIDRLDVDWQPRDLLSNRFAARSLVAGTIRIDRLPALRPTSDPRLLPSIDIRIDRLDAPRIILAAGVAGARARQASLNGRIDIAAGRALVQVNAAAAGSADRLVLDLDAEPDRNRFALAARLDAPAGGLVAGLAGLKTGLTATASGRGRWQAWNGRLLARSGLALLADAAITLNSGEFGLAGRIDPAMLMAKGTAATLLGGGLAINVRGRPRDGDVQVTATATGRWLNGRIAGRIDRAAERIEAGDLALHLADGAPLPAVIAFRGLNITANLSGPWLAPQAQAKASAAAVMLQGGITLDQVSASAIIDAGNIGAAVPAAVNVASVRGLPADLAPLAGRWQASGPLRWQAGALRGDGLLLKSGPLAARLGINWVPATGAWGARLAARVAGWTLPQLGSSDADINFDLRPGLSGSGTVRLTAARLPAGGLARLVGGQLAVSGRVALQPGLAFSASNLALSSPRLSAAGTAGWRANTLSLALTGDSRDWGPLRLDGGGRIGALVLDLALARPGYGLTSVTARLVQADAGWRVTAAGSTAAGAARLAAAISISPVLRLAISELSIAGFTASGEAVQTAAGPFAGDLRVTGTGLSGNARLFGDGALQKAALNLSGDAVRLALETPVTIDQLKVEASLSLPETGPILSARLNLRGGERGSLVVDKAVGSIDLADGRGTASLIVSGDTGVPFDIALKAGLTPGQVQLSGDGRYDGREAKLAGPATLSWDADGWHLSTTRLASALGNAEITGDWGERRKLVARLDKVSLALVGLAYPSVNLAGRVSGTLDLAQKPGEAPSGRAELRLIGLSRSAITTTSTPIDVGLNAVLGPDGTVLRALVMRAGAVEGRAQARIGAVTSWREGLIAGLAAASVNGQLRYAGPAQDLWGLSGLTALDLRGQAQVAADLSGTLGDPVISGRIIARNGRVEAPLLGAVASAVSLDARFNASRLELTRFSGTSGGGSITGTGSIDLSLERGFPMDIRMAVKDAAILGRDDISAIGSGTVRVATDEYGGVVSGTLQLARTEYRVGRTAVADVPVLTVAEKNLRVLGRRVSQYVPPTRWLYNLVINADRQLLVTGMGIKSEWQADVRLRGAANAPELFGRVQLVRGDYDFAGKRFQLTRGDIRFQGGYPPDPIINVTAENTGNGFNAQLSIEGTAQRPQIRFSSVPSLPEDEVLSRVLFGSRVTDLSAPEAIQLAGALSSLRGGGFNPIGAVSKGLGIDRLRILPADATMGRKTSVAAGQYLGRNVYVELATDAQGYTATSIEIGLTRSLSLLSSIATLGGTAAGVRWTKDY